MRSFAAASSLGNLCGSNVKLFQECRRKVFGCDLDLCHLVVTVSFEEPGDRGDLVAVEIGSLFHNARPFLAEQGCYLGN